MKYISIDLETTGLKRYGDNQILEFGAILDDLENQLPVDELPRFHTYIYHHQIIGESYALSMHSDILRKISEREPPYTYLSPDKLGISFKKFLLKNGYEAEHDKIVINAAGKNFASFDLTFLERTTDWTKHIKTRQRILDPAILYYKKGDDALLCTLPCLQRAGFTNKKVICHTAIEDAIDIIKLIRHKLG